MMMSGMAGMFVFGSCGKLVFSLVKTDLNWLFRISVGVYAFMLCLTVGVYAFMQDEQNKYVYLLHLTNKWPMIAASRAE